jgi:hypothetical protein
MIVVVAVVVHLAKQIETSFVPVPFPVHNISPFVPMETTHHGSLIRSVV